MSTHPHGRLGEIGEALRAAIPNNHDYLLIVYPVGVPITPEFVRYTGSTGAAGTDPAQIADATKRGLNAAITAANAFVIRAKAKLDTLDS